MYSIQVILLTNKVGVTSSEVEITHPSFFQNMIFIASC